MSSAFGLLKGVLRLMVLTSLLSSVQPLAAATVYIVDPANTAELLDRSWQADNYPVEGTWNYAASHIAYQLWVYGEGPSYTDPIAYQWQDTRPDNGDWGLFSWNVDGKTEGAWTIWAETEYQEVVDGPWTLANYDCVGVTINRVDQAR